MCYCPTPTLHLNLALTWDCAFLLSPQKTHSVWFISVLNYGDTENVLINHLLLVISVIPCLYTHLCPHKQHNRRAANKETHTRSKRNDLKTNKYLNIYCKICIRYISIGIIYINIIICNTYFLNLNVAWILLPNTSPSASMDETSLSSSKM